MFRPNSALKMKLAGAGIAARQLSVYRSLTKDDIFMSMLGLLDLLVQEKPTPQSLFDGYFDLTHRLFGVSVPSGFHGNAWQYHLINLILKDDNPFSRRCETTAFDKLEHHLKKAAGIDMRNLSTLAFLDAKSIRHTVKTKISDLLTWVSEIPSFEAWPDWEPAGQPLSCEPQRPDSSDPGISLGNALLSADDWESKLPDVARFYAQNGTGIFGTYAAFRWVRSGTGGYLQGIEQPDPITFDNLIGYQKERKIVIDNTEKLLQGLPANNILLYGERGTGKSSTVKALVHEFGNRGLRLVEVSKQHLADFPQIIRLLKKRAQKFIIFVDDLSFEENEAEYKHLKGLLEGGLEARPANILIYATSNRRHLIKEYFSDRDTVASHGEVRVQDTLQEKLSLSDRFGITVTFISPAQAEYLAIVDGLARQAGLCIPQEELHRQALQWELRYNGRSGRTARQFIDWLIGEKKRKTL